MAVTNVIAGAVLCKIGSSSLGYTINGLQVSERTYVLPIYGDQNGGDAGPPIEWQIMGEVHRLTMELNTYDPSVAAALLATTSSGTPGTERTSGVLLISNSYYYNLVFVSTGFNRNYARCIIEEAKEFNAGTRHTVLRVTASAYGGSGATLYS